MLPYLTYDLIPDLIVFQLVILLIIVTNLRLLHRARQHPAPANFPLVSVLIPARNEEQNIARCVTSLLAQDYPRFEILVLDDQSSDTTFSILTELSKANPGLRALTGSPPPEGLAGKNWACAQLAQQARGELLFFTDADTEHQPGSLRAAVSALLGEKADLLSGFPGQQVITWGEKLLVPFFSWASISYLPLWLAYRLPFSALTLAVGQMMLFRRAAYEQVGGHAALGMEIVDDLTLARRVKAAGLRWRLAHISDLISSRMYRSAKEALRGFTKNLFAAFGFRLLIFLFVFLWLLVQFWAPIIALALFVVQTTPPEQYYLPVVCIFLALLLWVIAYIELRIPVWLALLYPITVLITVAVALRSAFASLTGRLAWKDRPLARPRWKWL